ncbi:type II toxin-antitoxin system VapC family toxin [Nocardiopsis kunsanensis]|uniref:Ribonuclease VapC n=1 Tax=Nocardiopsis kunsanensis TaxID=141693 RepID=A0A918XG96_9ACTN|nr:type II toxin-antitoxin system VapC family toxin [Nocardiopsis kunsanensis]GHD30523.1 ribonuclease VapC [Nocardiopsis kunsanensis]
MIVLDTNVVSELFRPHPEPRVVAWLEALTDDVAITTITLAELLAGVRRLPGGRRREDLEAAIDGAVRPYRDTRSLLAFDEEAAAEYAEVLLARERAGLPIATADAQIASICRLHRAVCATRNTKDFTRTGVELVDPWLAP